MINKKPINNEPSQQEWLDLDILEQSYWLLKIIDHYRESSSFNPTERTNQDYQRETMLINAPSFDHHNSRVNSAVSRCTQWLLQHELIADYPSQQNGIYKITEKGLDVIDLSWDGSELISNLISFADNLHKFPIHKVTPINLLGILVRRMEKTGQTNEHTTITLSNRIAANLSRSNNRRITLESLESAANICKSRKYLSQRYVSSGPYERLHLTDLGLSYYDQNKNEDEIEPGPSIPPDNSIELPTQTNTLPGNINESDNLVKSSISVQTTIVYSASLLIEPLKEFRERVRSDNLLSAENSEHRDELLELIDRLLEQMRFLIDKIPIDVGSEFEDDISETTSWARETYVKTLAEFEQYFSPDSISKIVAPTTITLGLGILGTAFGGSAGFAAGTFVGNVVTRSTKPKELSDKLNQQIESSTN